MKTIGEHLPSPRRIKKLFPLSFSDLQFVERNRLIAQNIIAGKDPRKAIVVGPCSIHDRKSTLEYAMRFKELSERVAESCFLVMRVYIEKPRTITGWKGLIYDPFLDNSDDMSTGLVWARQLLTELTQMGVPIATEFVDPLAGLYFQDLISWGFIGARTSASQPHRQFASSLQCPMGFKNSTDGNIDDAIHGIISTQVPHVFMNIDEDGILSKIRSQGNSSSHIVLRGSQGAPNYDSDSVFFAMERLKTFKLLPRLMIDCAHGNSQKHFERQPEVFQMILEQIERGNTNIFGLMLESHLREGSQMMSDPSCLEYAVSITDACINWSTTEELIYEASDQSRLKIRMERRQSLRD